jgi:hypothetical protein
MIPQEGQMKKSHTTVLRDWPLRSERDVKKDKGPHLFQPDCETSTHTVANSRER